MWLHSASLYLSLELREISGVIWVLQDQTVWDLSTQNGTLNFFSLHIVVFYGSTGKFLTMAPEMSSEDQERFFCVRSLLLVWVKESYGEPFHWKHNSNCILLPPGYQTPTIPTVHHLSSLVKLHTTYPSYRHPPIGYSYQNPSIYHAPRSWQCTT